MRSWSACSSRVALVAPAPTCDGCLAVPLDRWPSSMRLTSAFEGRRAEAAATGSARARTAVLLVRDWGSVAGARWGEGLACRALRYIAAHLAAADATNREIARTSYMSGRMVQAPVTKIYRELGSRSRAQLAAALSATANRGNEAPEDEGKNRRAAPQYRTVVTRARRHRLQGPQRGPLPGCPRALSLSLIHI